LPGMTFLRKKIAHLVLVVFVVSVFSFLLVDLLPADVAYELAGYDATLEEVESLREQLGLNDPIIMRYGRWLGGVFQGDLGVSLLNREPVWQAIMARLPVTIELLFIAQIFALLLAIPAGVFAAHRAETRSDRALGSIGFGLISIPSFAMAMLLIFLFSLQLKWLPATGYTPLSAGLWPNLKGFILPALAIALAEWVPLMRVLRSDMITTLQEDYILLAKSQGLPTRRILFRHALRPSCFTLLTIFGLQVGHLIGGALIIETVFALPGIGRLMIGAIFAQDSTIVQGCVLFITTGYLVINFLVDLGYRLLDPRIGSEQTHG
jgi:peptide/nickel transport system permease protein